MSRDKHSKGDLHWVVREGFLEEVTFAMAFEKIRISLLKILHCLLDKVQTLHNGLRPFITWLLLACAASSLTIPLTSATLWPHRTTFQPLAGRSPEHSLPTLHLADSSLSYRPPLSHYFLQEALTGLATLAQGAPLLELPVSSSPRAPCIRD